MCIRHKWKGVGVYWYNMVSVYSIFPDKFGGTCLVLICKKCGKTKKRYFPDLRLSENDFKGTKIGDMLEECNKC